MTCGDFFLTCCFSIAKKEGGAWTVAMAAEDWFVFLADGREGVGGGRRL